jgi:hypothetical protein
MEEEQQQQETFHEAVLVGIARLDDPHPFVYRERRHMLSIGSGYGKLRMDRCSLQYMVDFVDNGDDSHKDLVITKLSLEAIHLSHPYFYYYHDDSGPSDSGLQVLCTFFARSDTTLTKATLKGCDFGNTEETAQLISSFQTNRTVTDLTVHGIRYLRGVELGNSLSSLIQNMPQLQRLACSGLCGVEGVRAFQPALQANLTLRELSLSRTR